MKKVILIVSSLAFLFACSEDKKEANYNRCPQASADDIVNTIADVDGNEYKVVKIGDYEWFTSNLKTTKLADGTPIENIACEEGWSKADKPAYATYNNEESAEVVYNYAAVQANPCPEGWYVPSDTVEWLQLAAQYAGIEKAEGWDQVPTTIGWDNSSFAAKAAGFRERNGNFYKDGEMGLWWTSTAHNEANAMYVFMKELSAGSNKYVGLNKSHIGRTTGLSVRCVRKYDANNTYAKAAVVETAMDSTDAVSGATKQAIDTIAEEIVNTLTEEAKAQTK